MFNKNKILTINDLQSRIKWMGELSDGWLDGKIGLPLDNSALQRIENLFIELYNKYEIHIPYLYPTVNGNIQVEWTFDNWELTVTINLATGISKLDALDIKRNDHRQKIFHLYVEDKKINIWEKLSLVTNIKQLQSNKH